MLENSSRSKPDVFGLMMYDPGGMRSGKFKTLFKFRLIYLLY